MQLETTTILFYKESAKWTKARTHLALILNNKITLLQQLLWLKVSRQKA